MRIRSGIGMIPGGIIFRDPRVATMYWKDDHTFLPERVKEVVSFRLQNPEIYPPGEDGGKWLDPAKVSQEITDYNCQRLGNNPNFCTDGTAVTSKNVNATKSVPPVVNKCPTCKVDMIPHYCVTCGGSKIDRYDCPVCKKSY